MPTDTFQIGNGKTAKVGDKVWDAHLERIVERCVIITGGRMRCANTFGGRAVDVYWRDLFLSKAEAIRHRLELRRANIASYELRLANARSEVARLESMLATEGDGAKGSDDNAK